MRILLLILFLNEMYLWAQDNEITITTDAGEVIVFTNGAQVVRQKTVDIPQGTSVLKFTGLSPYLDAKSVQVNAPKEVMILSVNYQYNFIDSIKRSQELEALNSRLKAVENKIQLENVNIETVNEELDFLRENRNIGGKNQELSLNNFKQTVDFYRDRVAAAKQKLLEINGKVDKLRIEKANIERQIKQLSANKPLPVGEVLVKVRTLAVIRGEITLSYFVGNAGWYPTYDIRVNSIDEPVQIVYKANVSQNTSEEWKNVRLKLSSSDPKIGNVAPRLQTYYLDYHLVPPRYTSFSGQVSGKVFDAITHEPLPGVSIMIKGTTIRTLTDASGSYSLTLPENNAELEANYVGYQSQVLLADRPSINFFLQPEEAYMAEVAIVGSGADELAESPHKKSLAMKALSMPLPIEQTENNTSVEFEIKTPYTLNSDNKNITVDIETYQVDAEYEYHCVPKIDRDVFLIAKMVDWEKYNLLEGEANIFFENTYVG
ncbi:MAG: mucoidy inhibitor MuiA family protein, partial [Bacteroidales bacterium]